MIRFLLAAALTAMLSFIAGLFLPWWSLALVAAAVAIWIVQKPGISFLSGFLALFGLWGVLELWIDKRNNSILSQRIGELLGIGPSPLLLILISALVAGLVAGFAALTGTYFRKLVRKQA